MNYSKLALTFTQKNLQAPKIAKPKNCKAKKLKKPQSSTKSPKAPPKVLNFWQTLPKPKNILTNHPKTVDTKI
jgi:hypothetical protein